jgi:hypothetical protein
MTAPKVFVDGILQTWGERLYPEPVKMTKGKKGLTSARVKPRATPSAKKPTTGGAIRAKQTLKSTVKKTPEVMVKVTGGGRGMKAIRAHLDYISRNGQEPLETDQGDIVHGSEALKDLREEWEVGSFGVVPEESNRRHAYNIILSMPPGTDRKGVHHAARDFATEQFGGQYKYVFVSHHDESHPHVHLCVAARGLDGTRLNPRKDDLQQWRESFAEHLREHGIEANATRRQARGIEKKPVPQAVNQMRKRGVQPKHYESPNGRPNPANPYAEKQSRTRKQVVQAYGEIAKALAESEDVDDRKTAVEIVELVKAMSTTRLPERPIEPPRDGPQKPRDPKKRNTEKPKDI